MYHSRLFRSALAVALCLGTFNAASAHDDEDTQDSKAAASLPAGLARAAAAQAGDNDSKYPPYSKVIKDCKTYEGLFTLHQKENQLLGELRPQNLNRDYIVLISIAKGIGKVPLVGGYSWGFGDDWLWQFRKVGKKVHIVRRNVRFKAAPNSPESRAVGLAYTDSVLYSLPIVTTSPGGGVVVDLTGVFMSDLPQISSVLRGFSFSPSKSTWAAIKTFEDNVELEVAATYASGGGQYIDSVADSRGVTLNVHYSISALPNTGYQPRIADDRIGYFLTVSKSYSRKPNEDQFVRYINRWDLQKADPDEKLSPPKEPIVFWLEKTIPYKYRKPISDGILEWNKAFEKAGFLNAIEVRQQPDDATWDPEDINYNTFRWITADAGFAMGPSRVNPLTGQILDADIIFDAGFLNSWKRTYETFTPEGVAELTGGPLDLQSYEAELAKVPESMRHSLHKQCFLSQGQAMQIAMGSTVFAARQQSPEELEKLIMQGMKEVTMHEVGHTLGLRHNFKASRMYSLEELQDADKTEETGLSSSVMDYMPANLVPEGMQQGDFYSTTIGPYDVWAIEYGYTPLPPGKSGEAELKKIASRSGEPELAYATDEDTRGIDPDPTSNRFDLGDDQVAYAKMQAKLVTECWPGLVERIVEEGNGYERARQAFGILLARHGSTMYFAARYIGGLDISRSHKGDKNARAPFTIIDAERQRDALALLEEQIFSDRPFQFSPELYNQLATSRWSHWRSPVGTRHDLPVHEVILMWQQRILWRLLSPLTLERIHDSELKVPADQDAFTTAELLERLTKAIFAELDNLEGGEFTTRKPAISSLRRNLQRAYLKELAALAMGGEENYAPQDCQTLAYAQLNALQSRIEKTLQGDAKLDAYSQAHLAETAARIAKVTDARLMLTTP